MTLTVHVLTRAFVFYGGGLHVSLSEFTVSLDRINLLFYNGAILFFSNKFANRRVLLYANPQITTYSSQNTI